MRGGLKAGAGRIASRLYSQRIEAHPRIDGQRLRDAEIADALVARRSRAQPYCLYIHIPFCTFRCSFCALYTTLLPADDGEAVAGRFTGALVKSILQHPAPPHHGGPTTVHFGGGTPLSIGAGRLARVVEAIRARFAPGPQCEWAIETTASSLDPETQDALWRMGFRRIHLGVQTLEPSVRVAIGRQRGRSDVLDLIERMTERGFHVSVDMILGLEGTGAETLARDIGLLSNSGVRMFSLCELRLRGGSRSAEEHAHNYEAWTAAWARMHGLGLKPIHIGQFGRSQADNLYFTYPARGEACIALGPYSHGEFEDHWYQNHLLGHFEKEVSQGRTPIRYGLRFAPADRSVIAFERALLSHRIRPDLIRDCLEDHEASLLPLFRAWERSGYFEVEDASGDVTLSCEGSWFVGNLVADLRAASHARERAPA